MNIAPHKEQGFDWEGNEFPIRLTDLVSITNHYKIPIDSKIDIFRDQDYRLTGIFNCITEYPKDLEYYEDDKVKNIGFIIGEIIEAKSNGNLYLIKGFGISSNNQIPFRKNGKIYFENECNIYLDSIQLISLVDNKADKICDYFLGCLPEILFAGMTKRIGNSEKFKYRIGLDNYEKSEDDFRNGYSSAWDYSILNFEDQIICIQVVNKKHLPENMDGILIEYRNISKQFPDEKFRKIVREFLSFVLGTHLQKIGSSTFQNGYQLTSAESQNPWSRKLYRNGNMNPVPLKNGNDRLFFAKMLNKLFANFVKQYDQVSLSDCLWKLWIGQSLPVGTNLPILSSGLESLVDSYINFHKIQRNYTKQEKNDYNILIKDELESLEIKLEKYPLKSSVINKLKNPYNSSIGEKMKIFFKVLNITTDKHSIENQALSARNQMTHQAVNYETTEDQHNIKKLSDAYSTLINRVILKILEYDWYYIDYSKEGIRYLNIDENM